MWELKTESVWYVTKISFQCFSRKVKNNTYIALSCSDTVHVSFGWTYARRKFDVLFDVTLCCLVD